MKATSLNAVVFGSKLSPNTNKFSSSSYFSQNALEDDNMQLYSGKMSFGQLSVKVYAPTHNQSVNSYHGYSLNGIWQNKSVIRHWEY